MRSGDRVMNESGKSGRDGGDATPETLGARVRALRRAAGLSQTDLAGDRFSKEYVSQIERGKTTPASKTLDWIAERLGTDRAFLEQGVRRSEPERAGLLRRS